MRIISGKYGGRKIKPPAKMPYTRPTTDLAKEGLFNILQNRMDFEGVKTLDLFGGTGSITYELASRGATDLTVVEMDRQMYTFIKKNAETLGIENCKVLNMEVFAFLAACREKFDFIFAGPPYSLERIDEIPAIVVSKNLVAGDGFFVLEHTSGNNYQKFPGFSFQRSYGTTIFSFFEPAEKK